MLEVQYLALLAGCYLADDREISDVGSLRLTRGRITISLSDRGTVGQRHGSSRETRSRNGKYPEQVPSYGSTGNVRYVATAFTAFQISDISEADGFSLP